MACTSVGHFIRRMMIMQVSSRVGREWTCRFMISTPRRSSKSMQNSSKAQQRRGGGGLDPLQWTKVPCWLLLSLVLLILVLCPSACHGKYEQGYSEYNKDDNEDPSKRHVASLFQPPPQIRVLGPSEFPKPTDKLLLQNSSKAVQDMEPVVRVKPAYGHHRSNQDAILAYAEGYKLPWYQMFMETLTSTGYRGDVVLAIAEERIVSPHVVDYLKTFTVNDPNKPNLVLYQENLDCDNKSPSNTEYYGTNHRQLTKQGDTNPFQMCRLTNFYGWKKKQHDMDTDLQNNEDIVEPAADPRRGRVVATLRYEWYWIWSLQYEPDRWLMLLDARDSFFQTDPFVNLPRSKDVNSNNSQEKTSGLLYLFGENAQATRLGISKQNQQWIRRAYGDTTIEVLKGKPTICSGSTMGEQIAIESYLRAMVNEHDECSIKMMGADQGFHNVRTEEHRTNTLPTQNKAVFVNSQ